MYIRIPALVLACLALLATSVPAEATTISFTATGTSAAGNSLSAEATFTFNAGVLDITLANTQNPIGFIDQTLSGIAFTMIGSASLTLTGGAASGAFDCTSGTCLPISTPTAPFGWQWDGTKLFANNAGSPGGGFKPDAIVNASIDGSSDGIKNSEHNPYLLGPVTFFFTYTGDLADITGATFYFGTVPDTVIGVPSDIPLEPIPEPGSLVLLGTGLFGVVRFMRRRQRHPSA